MEIRGEVVLLLFVSFCFLAASADEFCPFTVKSYVGCFSISDSNNVFVPYNSTDPTFSPVSAAECACKCGNQGYYYAAIENLNECHCAANYTAATASTGCINHCIDNSTDLCGGFDDGSTSTYSVYQTSIGCDPACSANQTCQLFDNAFYMCVPSCQFTADFIFNVPCTSTGTVYLNVTSSTSHGTNFTYSVDGGQNMTAPYGIPVPFTFHVQDLHTFSIANRFGCSVQQNVTIPAASVPTQNQPPTLTFDPASMTLDVTYYKLLYPSESGNVQLQKYSIDYRYKCPSDTNYSSWISIDNSDTTSDTISVPFQYALDYDVRVYSTNCVGTSQYSPDSSDTAPASPYVPTIISVTPQGSLPTSGGLITISGIYFTSSPTVYVDGTSISASSVSDTQAVFQIGAGQGIHVITVKSFANFSCQEVLSTAFTWSYASPNVTSTSVLSNAGGSLTINGNNFGQVGAPNVSAVIDGTPCSSCAVSTSHSEITCNGCPAGTGGDHTLVVEVAGLSSSAFDFTYAICNPLCIFGECVDDDVCQCDDGYGGNDCSAVHVCAGEEVPSLGNSCGACTDTSVCCQFSSLVM